MGVICHESCGWKAAQAQALVARTNVVAWLRLAAVAVYATAATCC